MWPLQSQCEAFYGNPRGRNGQASGPWESTNLVRITPPFKIYFAGKPVSSLRIHNKCAESLTRIFNALWEAAGHDQKKLDEAGVTAFGGSYNFRLMRGSNVLSMHSYGCAIDLDPARNGFHDQHPHFANYPWVVKCFKDEGWTWGGDWAGRSKDGMHFQAARVG